MREERDKNSLSLFWKMSRKYQVDEEGEDFRQRRGGGESLCFAMMVGTFQKRFEYSEYKCGEEKLCQDQPHNVGDETEHSEDGYPKLEKFTRIAYIYQGISAPHPHRTILF